MLIFVTVTGMRDGRLVQETYAKQDLPAAEIDGTSAVARSRSPPPPASARWSTCMREGKLCRRRASCARRTCALADFLANRFGRYYADEGHARDAIRSPLIYRRAGPRQPQSGPAGRARACARRSTAASSPVSGATTAETLRRRDRPRRRRLPRLAPRAGAAARRAGPPVRRGAARAQRAARHAGHPRGRQDPAGRPAAKCRR